MRSNEKGKFASKDKIKYILLYSFSLGCLTTMGKEI